MGELKLRVEQKLNEEIERIKRFDVAFKQVEWKWNLSARYYYIVINNHIQIIIGKADFMLTEDDLLDEFGNLKLHRPQIFNVGFGIDIDETLLTELELALNYYNIISR